MMNALEVLSIPAGYITEQAGTSSNTGDFKLQGVWVKSLAKHTHGFPQSSDNILHLHDTNVPSWFHIV
jgi:hypothetical protein